MTTITIDQLQEAHACSEQVDRFRELFGKSIEVTEAAAIEYASEFDWDWAAAYLLSHSAQAEYDRVRALAQVEYDRVAAPARAEYRRVTAPARAEYDRVTAPAWAEYERVTAPAWAEYDRVTALALAEYDRVIAKTFARLYIAMIPVSNETR